jgi:hypothetical protein
MQRRNAQEKTWRNNQDQKQLKANMDCEGNSGCDLKFIGLTPLLKIFPA